MSVFEKYSDQMFESCQKDLAAGVKSGNLSKLVEDITKSIKTPALAGMIAMAGVLALPEETAGLVEAHYQNLEAADCATSTEECATHLSSMRLSMK